MKKIITLSIVCLASGQLFAQTSSAKAQPAEAKTKTQIEAQKQKETSSMSLKQATDAGIVPQIIGSAANIAPAANVTPTGDVATEPAEVIQQKTTGTPVKQEVKSNAPISQETKVALDAKVALEKKLIQEAAKSAPVKKN